MEKKKNFIIFKIDFEKAFHSLNWKFLESVMEQKGFGYKWISWIHGCLKSAHGSVIENGSPTLEFKIKKGLCQGDLILAAEALNIAFLEAKEKYIFESLKIGRDDVAISRLQFVDDALIMVEWSLQNAKKLFRIQLCLHMASGLKINFYKSKLFGVGVNRTEVERFESSRQSMPSISTTMLLSWSSSRSQHG